MKFHISALLFFTCLALQSNSLLSAMEAPASVRYPRLWEMVHGNLPNDHEAQKNFFTKLKEKLPSFKSKKTLCFITTALIGTIIWQSKNIQKLFFPFQLQPTCDLTPYQENQDFKPLLQVFKNQGISPCDQQNLLDVTHHYQSHTSSHKPGGVLFYGPPGTGKTTVVKALHKASGCNSLITATPAMLETPKQVQEIFDHARQDAKNSQTCTTLFLDELDQVGKVGSPSLNEILIQSTAPNNNDLVLFGATNYKKDLAPSLIRSGRFDYHVATTLPNQSTREEILNMLMQKTHHSINQDTLSQASALAEGFSFADLENTIKRAIAHASYVQKNSNSYTLTNQDLLNAVTQVKQKITQS